MAAIRTAAGVPVLPAPWSLTGEGWIIPIYTPFSEEPISLPDASYADLEKGTPADLSDRFHGGVGFVMIVRYTTGDAGPYDELMYVPGLFSRSGAKDGDKPQYDFAITRIYVSTDESVANGRRNWGIPKHRADFSFTPSGSSTLLTVSHPPSPSKPFFRCLLRDSRTTPFALPVSTSWLSSALVRPLLSGYNPALVQPPLPAAESDAHAVRAEGQRADVLVGSERTFVVEPTATGWSRVARIEPCGDGEGDEWTGFGDGKSFPRFEVYGQRLNVHLTSFEMQFPAPRTLAE
ncbi:uncharacterized protein JCM10292_003322 [Rhodotorula paludigena]|uniref:uncharacterized protein n=1 Tax=Rhodotorula paludigena TaxID=86838 RepID=UPI00317352AC